MNRPFRLHILLLLMLLPPGANAAAFGETVRERGVVPYDRYLAGGSVDVDAEVLGDLVTAGGSLDIAGRVAGDLLAAGGRLGITGEVEDDARLAGGSITVDARIGDHLAAAGGSIDIRPGTTVGGRAWLSGGSVVLDGRVDGPVRIVAGEVVIGGSVTGPLEIRADELQIRPGARIDGDLTYRAPRRARIDAGARIGGEVRFQPAEDVAPGIHERESGPTVGGMVLFVLALGIVGALLHAVFPQFTRNAAAAVRTEPLLSLGVGALVVFAAPVAIIVLALLVVTLPVALAGLAVLPVTLLLGYVVFAFALADAGARRLRLDPAPSGWRRLLALAVTLLVLGLAQEIPWVGGLLLLAALLFGTGAALVSLGRRYRADPRAS